MRLKLQRRSRLEICDDGSNVPRTSFFGSGPDLEEGNLVAGVLMALSEPTSTKNEMLRLAI